MAAVQTHRTHTSPHTSTGIAVYAALLWALDLLDQLDLVATPERDQEGQTLALARERGRARPRTELSNDF